MQPWVDRKVRIPRIGSEAEAGDRGFRKLEKTPTNSRRAVARGLYMADLRRSLASGDTYKSGMGRDHRESRFSTPLEAP